MASDENGRLTRFADHVEFVAAATCADGSLRSRNAVVCGHGRIDRSPCGTGTCARMATLHARGKLPLRQAFKHEGILGTVFTGELLREVDVGAPYPAVVPTLSGRAWITATANYVLDPTDPFPEGFIVGDLWGGID